MPKIFRVHLVGEDPIDINAEDATDARKQAEKARPGAFIKKIKVVKGNGHG
jgi:hypothetical protein